MNPKIKKGIIAIIIIIIFILVSIGIIHQFLPTIISNEYDRTTGGANTTLINQEVENRSETTQSQATNLDPSRIENIPQNESDVEIGNNIEQTTDINTNEPLLDSEITIRGSVDEYEEAFNI